MTAKAKTIIPAQDGYTLIVREERWPIIAWAVDGDGEVLPITANGLEYTFFIRDSKIQQPDGAIRRCYETF